MPILAVVEIVETGQKEVLAFRIGDRENQQEQIEPELKALFYQKDRQAVNQAAAAFIANYDWYLDGNMAEQLRL